MDHDSDDDDGDDDDLSDFDVIGNTAGDSIEVVDDDDDGKSTLCGFTESVGSDDNKLIFRTILFREKLLVIQ